MRNNDWTRILGWPGFQVYRSEINEPAKTLKLCVRRKVGKIACSGCGRGVREIAEVQEREVRDLPYFEYRTTVIVELYRVRCPECRVKAEKIPQLPSKAPFSKRFEDAVGESCESAAARRVAKQFGLAASTVRSIDPCYLERWRRSGVNRHCGNQEWTRFTRGKKQKFLTVASSLESGEPLWFGRERKKKTLDGFFEKELNPRQRRGIEAACVDMWEAFRQSIEQWAPQCRIVYDKFPIMQHANRAVDEVRRAEFFRKGGHIRGLVKGKRWLLLTRQVNLTAGKRRELNELFTPNRRLLKAQLLKESLDRLWDYRYAGAMMRYFKGWLDPLRWQRLTPFQKLVDMLGDAPRWDLELLPDQSTAGSCRSHHGNIKTLLRRGRGYQNLRYLLLKAQRLAATRTEFVALSKAA